MNRKIIDLPTAILASGLIVGTFDAVAASVFSYGFSGASPDRVFRYVASGIFGKDALTGGMSVAVWGLFFHYIVATGWTALFYFLYPKIKVLSSSKYMAGIAYGLFIWLMMNFVVVPLSNVPPSVFHFTVRTAVMIMIHMFIIGVPISYMVNKYYSSE
jgi:uncharacterized membrane protein